jgi:hypothetical protein
MIKITVAVAVFAALIFGFGALGDDLAGLASVIDGDNWLNVFNNTDCCQSPAPLGFVLVHPDEARSPFRGFGRFFLGPSFGFRMVNRPVSQSARVWGSTIPAGTRALPILTKNVRIFFLHQF